MKYARLASIASVAVLLAACGGGGGGDGGANDPNAPPTLVQRPSEASTGIAAPTRPLVYNTQSLLTDPDKVRLLVKSLADLHVKAPGLIAGQRAAALNPNGATVAGAFQCTTGQIQYQSPTTSLPVSFQACFDGVFTIDGAATRTPPSTAPYTLAYAGGLNISATGIPVTMIIGSTTCTFAGGAAAAQCVSTHGPTAGAVSAGYTAAYAAGVANGTYKCDCFAESTVTTPVHVTVLFDAFGPTSGKAYVYATDGAVYVNRLGANSYDVWVGLTGTSGTWYRNVTPL